MRVINVSKVVVRRALDGKYLLLRSGKWEERPDRSRQPDLPGGVVEAGERVEEGAARELLEETAIEVAPNDLTLVYAMSFKSDRDNAAINRLIYFTELQNDPEIKLSWEHEEFWWVDANELRSLEIREPYPTIINYLTDVELLK